MTTESDADRIFAALRENGERYAELHAPITDDTVLIGKRAKQLRHDRAIALREVLIQRRELIAQLRETGRTDLVERLPQIRELALGQGSRPSPGLVAAGLTLVAVVVLIILLVTFLG